MKTNKAQIMHCIESLTEEDVTALPESPVHVIDGNALFQGMVHLPDTFDGFASSVFSSLPASETVHFVTDTYLENSVKQLERSRRGSSPTYLLGGGKTRLPRDFKSFLHNSENKRQLTRFLLTQWQSPQYAPKLRGRSIFFVCENECYILHSEDGLTVTMTPALELFSDQEEADSRIVLHCLFEAQKSTSNSSIVVHSPDTDVFILLLHYSFQISCTLLFYTGSGNNRRTLDVHKFARELESDICTALPAFHAFTGCDTTSAFVRKGKKGPFRMLQKNTHAVEAFKSLGTDPNTVSETTFRELEKFVCCMYGKSSYVDVNRLRYDTFKSRYEVRDLQKTLSIHNGVDISLLPPCRESLMKHCQRANYQAYIWTHAHIATIRLPSPVGCGWKLNEDGTIAVDWIKDALPQPVVEVLSEKEEEAECREQQLAERSEDEMDETETCEYVEEDEIDNIIDAVFEDDDIEAE